MKSRLRGPAAFPRLPFLTLEGQTALPAIKMSQRPVRKTDLVTWFKGMNLSLLDAVSVISRDEKLTLREIEEFCSSLDLEDPAANKLPNIGMLPGAPPPARALKAILKSANEEGQTIHLRFDRSEKRVKLLVASATLSRKALSPKAKDLFVFVLLGRFEIN